MLKLFLLVTSFLSFSAETFLRKSELNSFSFSAENFHRKRELHHFFGDSGDSDKWKQLNNFQERFSKRYKTIEEMKTHLQIFRSNLRNIIFYNLDTTQNFTMGINQWELTNLLI
jgi:hypothetical protein